MIPDWKKLLQSIWCFSLTQGRFLHSLRIFFPSSSFFSPCFMIFNPELLKFLFYLHSNVPQPVLGKAENFVLCGCSVNDISDSVQDIGCRSWGEQESPRPLSATNSSSRGGGKALSCDPPLPVPFRDATTRWHQIPDAGGHPGNSRFSRPFALFLRSQYILGIPTSPGYSCFSKHSRTSQAKQIGRAGSGPDMEFWAEHLWAPPLSPFCPAKLSPGKVKHNFGLDFRLNEMKISPKGNYRDWTKLQILNLLGKKKKLKSWLQSSLSQNICFVGLLKKSPGLKDLCEIFVRGSSNPSAVALKCFPNKFSKLFLQEIFCKQEKVFCNCTLFTFFP